MKTNKEEIYEFIKMHDATNSSKGLSTNYIAKMIGMQRTNVSILLNQMVDEGRLTKQNGRPVLYSLSAPISDEVGVFKNLIGFDGSLKSSVQLAKAGIVYPPKSLNSILFGAKGTGKRTFARAIHGAAQEWKILSPSAQFVEFHCPDYVNSEEDLFHELFGADNKTGAIGTAENGTLFLDRIDVLQCRVRRHLLKRIAELNTKSLKTVAPMVIVSCENEDMYHDNSWGIEESFPIAIRLPSLAQRPLPERFALVRGFVILESASTKRTIRMESELLYCLMLCECEQNVQTLKSLIKKACVNAYLRASLDGSNVLSLYISDFEPVVRKGIINYRKYKEKLDDIISPHTEYYFDQNTTKIKRLDSVKPQKNRHDFERRISESTSLSFDEAKTHMTSNPEDGPIGSSGQIYSDKGTSDLEKRVPKQIIDFTEDFLSSIETTLGRPFSQSSLHEICIYLGELISGNQTGFSASPEQTAITINENEAAYSIAAKFAKGLQESLNRPFSVEEIAHIALLLSQPAEALINSSVTLLLVFHGSGIAKALGTTIKGAAKVNNVFTLDIPFDQEDTDTYEQLRDTVSSADRGCGVLAVIDFEFLRQMLYTISLETGIEIRTIALPITKFGVEWSRRASITQDLNRIYENAGTDVNGLLTVMRQVIVTLCTTSEGTASQMRSYLLQHNAAPGVDIVPLSISDMSFLKDKLLQIMRDSTIQCIIGTYDPKLFAIPFVSVSDVLSAPLEALPELLRGKKPQDQQTDMAEIYKYLAENLENVKIKHIQEVMETLINTLGPQYNLPFNVKVGLVMHIACAANRIAGKEPTPVNPRKVKILEKYTKDYKDLRKLISPLEKKMSIIFPDDELANILMIVKEER